MQILRLFKKKKNLKTIIPLEDKVENLDDLKLGKDVLDDTKT